ncbi:Sensor protein PhoQ [Salinisphaera sp. PC39]|uniref:ATP-binding protein n=1 Tax=Salinisphaera sp. PC39 TaxID=1304156 RepID=UPI00334297B1
MNSLTARLLAVTGVVLVAFVAFTGFALEQAVRERAEQAARDKMQGLVYALLGNAEIAADGGFALDAGDLPQNALTRPGGGLYAMVLDGDGGVAWRSPSLVDRIPLPEIPAVGEWRFDTEVRGRGADDRWLTLAFGIRWVVDGGESYRYTLVVAEDAAPFAAQMQRFRGALWMWLGAAAAVLLALQLAILRWGLAPLRRLARGVRDIEAGRASRIEGGYPAEIAPLADNLNLMLANDQARLERYRNALGDLAHSLKTPIAVLRGLASDRDLPARHRRQLESQLGRVNEIVDYQLQRAAAAGGRSMAPPVSLRDGAAKVIGALRKVYADREIEFELAVPAELKLAVDAGDLTEILGNLLDNAAKYGRRHVRLGARAADGRAEITVDDDGDGFPADAGERLLERGVRADTRREGQGIGLAVTAEIVRAYDGAIELAAGPDGGGRVRLWLPRPAA